MLESICGGGFVRNGSLASTSFPAAPGFRESAAATTSADALSLDDQLLQGLDVSAIVAGTVDWRFRDEGGVLGPRIVEQPAKDLSANLPFSHVLVAVELGAAIALGIVAVPHVDVLQADGLIEVPHRLAHALGVDDVVAGDVRVAGVDTGPDGNDRAQQFEHLRNLLEAAAERVLCAGGVFDENGQVGGGQIQTLAGGRNCGRCANEPLFA